MAWFFVTLPLLVLTAAVAAIPRLVPAVREQRAHLSGNRTGANGRSRVSPGPRADRAHPWPPDGPGRRRRNPGGGT